MRTTTRITIIAVACLATAGLAGCAAKTTTSSTPTTTVTTTTAPSPTDSTTTAPISPSTPTTGTGVGTAPGAGLTACTSANLTASISTDAGGGAAGSTYVSLVLTNKGTVACTLQGWPGVSFVGDGNGTQLGAAAQQDRASLHATVTINAGKTAIAPLRVTDALNFPVSTCKPTTADGFRVYPPGEKYSMFIKDADFTACSDKKDVVLTISAIRPTK